MDIVNIIKVLKTLKTKKSLLNSIQKRKLKYIGHKKGKKKHFDILLEGGIEGKRPQGRPHNTWMADIKEWTGRKGGECTKMAADCNLWGVISHQPLSRK